MAVTGNSLNAEVVQGNTKNLDFNVTGSGIAPFSLEDVDAIVWSMSYNYDSGEVVLTKTLGDGITILDPVAGKFRVTLLPDDTEAMPAGCYRHEAVLTDTFGQIITVTDANGDAGCLKVRQRIAVA